jgi:hypothetical protein
MIYQKPNGWKIRGNPRVFSTKKEAEAFESGEEPVEEEPVKERILQPTENTPYENMIEKSICKLCNLEPCECFISIKKTELGS